MPKSLCKYLALLSACFVCRSLHSCSLGNTFLELKKDFHSFPRRLIWNYKLQFLGSHRLKLHGGSSLPNNSEEVAPITDAETEDGCSNNLNAGQMQIGRRSVFAVFYPTFQNLNFLKM
jgi:hypothetical protein